MTRRSLGAWSPVEWSGAPHAGLGLGFGVWGLGFRV